MNLWRLGSRVLRGVVGGICLAAGCTEPADSGATDLGAADSAAPADLFVADCADMTGDRGLGGVCVHTVTGQVMESGGGPIVGAVITVCATACFYGKTDANGLFTVPIHQYLLVDRYSLLLHVQPRYAAYYTRLPPGVNGNAAFPRPLLVEPLPSTGPAFALDSSAQTLTADGVTLTVPAGTKIIWSFEDASEPDLGKRFRPRRFPGLVRATHLGDEVGGLIDGGLWAFGPFEPDFSGPVRLSLPNPDKAALPAGAAVAVLGQRGLLTFSPPGFTLDRVARAHVSSDGQRVEMDAGEGLRTLTWIALRKE